MKKFISFALLVTLIAAFFVPISQAADMSTQDNVIQVISALGVMNGDEHGNLNLLNNVTRAEYAKILVTASIYKNSVSAASNVSPFRDVPYTHWAASYIKTAAQNKWITGYLDGTYCPDNYLTLEEAATVVLKLLGYSGSDFVGAYPYGQLALYRSLGLSKNIAAAQGSYVTRQECMNLIYNMLTTKSKNSSSVYITTLGYKVSSDNQIDYSALVNSTMAGPVIVTSDGWVSALPFSVSDATVYRNGAKCTAGDISTYDVVYFSQTMRTVWAYSNKVSGTYEKAAPNRDYPTSVTVSGTSYSISSSSAAYALSNLGTYSIGDIVTLLLGKDGSVVAAASASEVNTALYGIVVSESTKDYTDANNGSYKTRVLTVVDTAGVSHEYPSSYYSTGNLVSASIENGKTVLSSISATSLTGTVSTVNNKIGKYPIAADIQILDVSGNLYTRIYPSRLDGTELISGNVLFYSLNEKGALNRLILNNVTNDMNSFGIVTDMEDSGATNKKYSLLIDGAASSVTKPKGTYTTAAVGGCMFVKAGGSITQIKSLTRTEINSLNESYATAKSITYPMSDNVSVYVQNGTGYFLSSVSIVSDTDTYSLSAYFDKPGIQGGRVRVIIATPNAV